MKKRIYLDDIPADRRNNQYLMDTYNVSRISAWRLLAGKVPYITLDYHTEEIIVSGWDALTSDRIDYMRNCIAYQLKKWRVPPRKYIDDIAQEATIRAYNKSGVWADMPEEKMRAYLANLAKHTVNDYMIREMREIPTADPADEEWHDN